MFNELEEINARPKPFEFYTAGELWADEYTSNQMLSFHLNEDIDVSSRNKVFIDRSVEWISSRFRVAPRTRIADFGCGPGLYAIRLAKKKADVLGIDFSPRSIQFARKAAADNGLAIRYVQGNYLEFETKERFHLILMIMCDFCALSPAQRKLMLTRFRAFLKPGGSILFDVYSLAAFAQRMESVTYEANLLNGFWAPDKYYGFRNTFKYEAEKVILEKYTIVEPERKRTVYNWLQYFSPEDLAGELDECGLVIEELYSDVSGSPFDPGSNEFAVVAGPKPA